MRSSLGFPTYFDGGTEREGVSFRWEGEEHLSTSVALLNTVSGWTVRYSEEGPGYFVKALPLEDTRPNERGRGQAAYAYAGDPESEGDPQFFEIEISPVPTVWAEVEPNVEYSASISHALGKVGADVQVYRSVAFIDWVGGDPLEILSRTYGTAVEGAWGGGDPEGAYSSWLTREVNGVSPANASSAMVGIRVEIPPGERLDPSSSILVDKAIMVIGDSVPEYFDGATPNDAYFTYSWDGEPDRSESTRVGSPPVDEVGPIVDPNCPPPPPAPMPPQPEIGCEDSIEEWRRVWYVIPAEDVYEWGAIIPSFTIESGALDVDALRITIWENLGDVLPENFDEDQPYEARWNVSYLPANSTMTIDGTTERITATQPGGTPQNAGYLVTGPGSGPVLWSKLTCGDGYLIAVDTPLGDDPENITLTASLTREFG